MKHPPRRLFALLPLLLLTASLAAQEEKLVVPELKPAGAGEAPATVPDLLNAMSADELVYFQHVTTLSNPFFEGRAPGTRGNTLAAEYVEFHFKQLGLQPAYPSLAKGASDAEVKTPWQSYRQNFTTGRELNARKQAFSFSADGPTGVSFEFTPGKDFYARGTSASAAATGGVVFVGYAADNPDSNYRAFAEGDDLTGKIAIVLRFEPINDAGKSRWNEGEGFSNRATLSEKFVAIAERHAAAIIMVAPPGVDDPRAKVLDDPRASRVGAAIRIPVLNATVEAVDKLCRAAGTTLMDLRQQADEQGVVRDLPGVTARIEVELTRDAVFTDNVAAVLPGKGALKDEYIVVGAHYDHIGYGYFGSRAGSNAAGRLHPGADDNASGTAGLLMSAKHLQERYRALPGTAEARSIMFVAFSGEEGGLYGSRYMIRNMPVEAKQTYAMLNMDMIGRLRDDKLEVHGVGTARGFTEYLTPFFGSSGLQVKTVEGGQGPSDHASFYTGNVPVLHFFTGYHSEYHMPGDEYQHINAPGALKVTALLESITAALAQRTEPLVFRRTGRNVQPEEPDVAAKPPEPAAPANPVSAAPPDPHAGGDPNAPAPAGPGGARVRFGIAPGSYGEGGGVLVSEVFDGTSAAEAGIKAGDVIIKWDDLPLDTVEDWMKPLARAKPGDQVILTVKRGKETLQLTAKLKARGQPAN